MLIGINFMEYMKNFNINYKFNWIYNFKDYLKPLDQYLF